MGGEGYDCLPCWSWVGNMGMFLGDAVRIDSVSVVCNSI
jgi:hypothetical protein